MVSVVLIRCAHLYMWTRFPHTNLSHTCTQTKHTLRYPVIKKGVFVNPSTQKSPEFHQAFVCWLSAVPLHPSTGILFLSVSLSFFMSFSFTGSPIYSPAEKRSPQDVSSNFIFKISREQLVTLQTGVSRYRSTAIVSVWMCFLVVGVECHRVFKIQLFIKNWEHIFWVK